MKHQLKPLPSPYPAAVTELLASYPKTAQGQILGLFTVFANSPRFLSGKGVLNLLDAASPLPLRERELVILRVTANLGCEYEWGVHVAGFANAAQFDQKQIAATRLSDADDPVWSEEDAALLRIIDDLCREGKIAGQNLVAFQKLWDLEQQLEILALCGNYHTVSFVANNSQLEKEKWAPSFPASDATL